MDDRTGEIHLAEKVAQMQAEERAHMVEMNKQPPTEKQMNRNPPRVGRNEPCPCGSGKKFKHCHWKGAPNVI